MSEQTKIYVTKYAKLDRVILNKIGGTPVAFSGLFHSDIEEECSRIADEHNKVELFRILDRRLQALRKLGKIKHITGKGWVKA